MDEDVCKKKKKIQFWNIFLSFHFKDSKPFSQKYLRLLSISIIELLSLQFTISSFNEKESFLELVPPKCARFTGFRRRHIACYSVIRVEWFLREQNYIQYMLCQIVKIAPHTKIYKSFWSLRQGKYLLRFFKKLQMKRNSKTFRFSFV